MNSKLDNMKVIYIASPYTIGDKEQNVMVQIDAAHSILDMGHSPIAPLLNHFLNMRRERPESDWIVADLALVRKSDIVLRLPGESKGADGEVAEALRLSIPVCHGWGELDNFIYGEDTGHE